MSIKIYNGFRIQGDIFVALDLVKKFRPYIKRESEKKLDLYMKMIGTRDAKNSWTDWLDDRREMAKTGYRNPLVDTDFKLTLFPRRIAIGYDGVPEDEVYGIAYHDTPKWFDKWMKFSTKISEFGYWDNTDQPEGMSYEDFKARGELWNELLGKEGVPAMYGLSIDVSDPMGPFPKALRIEAKKERQS